MRTTTLSLLLVFSVALRAGAQAPLVAAHTKHDLSRADPSAAYWNDVPESDVGLLAQPLVTPRPAVAETTSVRVQALHDGEHLALRLRWKAATPSEGGRPGKQSDAVAVQFPAREGDPPGVFMGVPGNPVYILHWRSQYQRDERHGKPDISDVYPRVRADMYPLEFADSGRLPEFSTEERAVFSPARALGNPQAFPKKGADEILAEGFSTSAVMAESQAMGVGEWADGEWTVVLVRPLGRDGIATLVPGGSTFVAFAVWQGAAGEVGSRKSVTMMWTPLQLADPSSSARTQR